MKEPSSSRWGCALRVGLIGAISLAGLLYGLRYYAEDQVATRLARSGVSLRWQELRVDWSGGVVLQGVHAEAASGALEATAQQLQVRLRLTQLGRGLARVERVALRGVSLRVDAEHPRWSRGARARPANPREATRASLAHNAWLSDLARVDLEDVEARVFLGPRAIGTGRLRDGSWTPAGLSGRGEFRLADDIGVQVAPIAFKASGQWLDDSSRLDVEVTPAAGDVLASASVPGLGGGRVGSARASISPAARALDLVLSDVTGMIGSPDEALISVEAAGVGVRASPGRPTDIWVAAPRMIARPSHADILRRAPPTQPLRAGAAPASTLRARALRWLSRARLFVHGGAVELAFSDRRLVLVDELEATANSGAITAQGTSAQGRLALQWQSAPPSWAPQRAYLVWRDVRLDALPGMREGRTLPRRGFRGRVGGLVDLTAAWVAPASRFDPAAAGHLDLSMDWRDGLIDAAGLADEPIQGLALSARAAAQVRPQLHDAQLTHGLLTSGPIALRFDGVLRDVPHDTTIQLDAKLDKIDCEAAARALPEGLLGPYEDIQITGSAAPTVSLYLPWRRPGDLKLRLRGFVDRCQVQALRAERSAWPDLEYAPSEGPDLLPPAIDDLLQGRSPPDDVRWLNSPFIKQVKEGVSEDAQVFVGPGLDSYVPLAELAPYVGAAAYLSEEINFYDNQALSLGHLRKALRMNLSGGEFVYGGSTIEQQLVKNLFLTRDKTLARKLREALIAWRMGEVVSKDRILELYLNCIEYGEDLYGIGPAARYYFGKDARDLTPVEAVFLAIIKPAPWYGERFKRAGTTPTKHWWFNRMGEIMERLVARGFVSGEQAAAAQPYVLTWGSDGAYRPAPGR